MKTDPEILKSIAKNKKVEREYFIEYKIEAGIVLQGTEVKSIRNGKVNINDAYAKIDKGELWLYNCYIAPYEQGNIFNHDPFRKRKLLVKKSEIKKLIGKVFERGYSMVVTEMYFNEKNIVKLLLAIVKGKKKYDRREELAKKESMKEIEAKFKSTRF